MFDMRRHIFAKNMCFATQKTQDGFIGAAGEVGAEGVEGALVETGAVVRGVGVVVRAHDIFGENFALDSFVAK